MRGDRVGSKGAARERELRSPSTLLGSLAAATEALAFALPHIVRSEAGMAAKFVVKKGSTGKFRFNLVASNGEVIATSELYNSKASAMKGIESVKKNAPTAVVDDQTSSK